MRLLVRVLVNAAALAVAAWLFDGIRVRGHDLGREALTLLAVGVIFGVVNTVVAPVVKLLALPFVILTLGLLLLVINALMLLLTSEISKAIDLGFRVDGFWTALWGSIVVSISTMVIGALVPDD